MNKNQLLDYNEKACAAKVPFDLLETKLVQSLPPYFGLVECKTYCDDIDFLMLLINTDDMVAAKFFYGNTYETGSLRIWTSLAQQSVVIFDIGSHTGVYALAAAAANSEAHILSFEPVAQNIFRQRLNARANGFTNIEIIGAAVCRHSAKIKMSVPNTGGYLDQGAKAAKKPEDPGVLVQGVSIDESVTIKQDLGLLKIDAEGGEKDALIGMSSTFEKHLPVTIFECNVLEICDPVDRFFKDFDYELFVINESSGVLTSVSHLGVERSKSGSLDRDKMNRLAIHKSKVDSTLSYLLNRAGITCE